MNRPFVVCRMISSVDGKIDGSWFGAPEVRQPLMESNTIRMNYNCSATLYGAKTMAETYAEGWVENLPQASQTYAREDYLASSDVARYLSRLIPRAASPMRENTSKRRAAPEHMQWKCCWKASPMIILPTCEAKKSPISSAVKRNLTHRLS